jgi:hypothetical protein
MATDYLQRKEFSVFFNSWYICHMDKYSKTKLDRSAFIVASLFEPSDEKQYWLAKTPYQRLEALEQMRQIIYGYHPTTTRLQRFFEVAQLQD